jgi:predicted dinucleotide-binding enzyme
VRGGHTVTIIDRDPEEAESLASELHGQGPGSARAGHAGAIDGDIVVLAVYYPGNKDLAQQLGSALTGKVVVDIANPMDPTTWAPAIPEGSSSAEEVAALVPNARVVKAFNTTFAGTLVAGKVAGQPLDVLIAGDEDEAKQTVAQLVRDGGLNPIDVGPLARARQLENLGYLGIAIQQPLGLGFSSAWKLLTQE